jgi:hypothetical protein
VGRPQNGAELAGAIIAAVAFPLVVAAAIRFAYAKLRRRRFATPWFFVIAAVVSLLFAAQNKMTLLKEDNRQAYTTVCVERVLVGFERIPLAERAFTHTDFAIFGERFCDEAFRRGWGRRIPSGSERDALADEVLHQLIESGEIKQLREDASIRQRA